MPTLAIQTLVDEVDRAIVRVLVANARSTFAEIGEHVGLSPAAAKRRLDRLERTGVVRGYAAVVDHGLLGHPLEAFTELKFSGNARVDSIASIGAAIPEVQEVYTVAGDPDAIVMIRVRDVQDLTSIHRSDL